MTDSSKTPSSGGRSANKTSGRKGEQQNQAAVVAQRRLTARKQAELRRQRRIIAVAGGAIGLALLAVLIGLLYDQLWIPSRPVAKVGTATLSRGDYWRERRLAFAREIAQNFQLLALFGSNQQFSAQFQNRSPAINQQLQAIRSTPLDDAVVTEWQNRQLKQQGAANLGIQVSQDEVNQQLVNDLSQIFLPPPPVTATQTLTPTEAATPAPQATATLTPTEAPTVTPGGPTLTPTVTATPEPTFTPAPTETPLPTVVAAVAAQQIPEIIDQIFRQYEVELLASDLEPELTKEEFRAALEDQYREQVLNTRIQERLVPEDGFVESSEPEQVSARQILVAVTPPEGATQEQIDQLFATAKARADELAQEAQAPGADFATLVAANSDDPGSREQGGDLGSFDRNGVADNGATYPPELVGAAYELALDGVSDPIRSQFGWHIIQVTDRQVPDRETQLREARTEALNTWVEEQRTALGVQRFPEPTATPSPLPETPEPTATPIYQPGPPTVAPTEPPAPTVTPTAETGLQAPTPGVEATSAP